MRDANENDPPRPRLVPPIGTLNIDTGVLESADVVQLIPENVLLPFANDHREA